MVGTRTCYAVVDLGLTRPKLGGFELAGMIDFHGHTWEYEELTQIRQSTLAHALFTERIRSCIAIVHSLELVSA